MSEQPTIEELQQALLELREEQETLKAAQDSTKKELEKANADLAAARKLNARLISGSAVPEKGPAEEDPYAGMSDEEALVAMIPEIVDRAEAKRHPERKD